MTLTTGSFPLSPGACKSLTPAGAEDVNLIFQVTSSIFVVGIPPFQYCLALFDGVDTIAGMLSSEVTQRLEPMPFLERCIVALDRVGWVDHPRGGNRIMVIEAMHIIENRENFIAQGP